MVKKNILFALLAAVTIFCHFFIDRYEKNGPEMLGDNWTLHTSESGRAEMEENGLFLFSSDQKKSVSIQQGIPSFDQGSILQLSADMKCEDIRPGEKPWHLARLLLLQNDGKKDRWNLPHTTASFIGTHDWNSNSNSFIIAPETKKIRVVAQLSQSTGSFRIKNLHLYPVTHTKAYPWIKSGILVAWGLFSVFLLGFCFFQGNHKTLLQVMLVLAFIAIIIGTTIPGDIKTRVSDQIVKQVHLSNDIFKPNIFLDISKIGHFCFFLLFGLALSMVLSMEPARLIMTHILLLAGTTELAQFFIDGRTPLFSDVIIDTAGGLIGIVLMKLFTMKRKEIKGVV